MSEEVRPHEIRVSEAAIADLRRRLEATRWPEKETVDDWTQGTPLAYLQEVCTYWANGYDMQRLAKRFAPYESFVTEIDGIDVQFFHIRSNTDGARPLVITHGWPGSQVEFLNVVEPLIDPVEHGGTDIDAFHLVLPSMVGYGWSGKPTTNGWSVEKMGDAWAILMKRLGYTDYFAQGGDWGSVVTTAIGIQDPENCAGIHLNMAPVRPDPSTMDSLTEAEKSALAGLQYYQEHDSGYSKQQSTRPQSVGYGLVDSPAGLAGWILEKFWAWTDCNGHPENVLTRDEMLDNLMVYWLNATGASSARLYWESFGGDLAAKVETPTGVSVFPKEIFRASRRWLEQRYTNLHYFNALDSGGHFAAMEKPDVFIDEVRAAFRGLR